MAESILKREFREKDIQRIRNLVKGKNGDKTTIGIGYSKTTEEHKEGDTWFEDGREWKIENGIKQNITRLDKFKNINVPLFCPSCNSVMNGELDANYYKLHNTCFNCYTKFETKLKIEGKWEEYQKDIHNKNIDKTIEEYTEFINNELNESNQSFIAENGDIEKWDGTIDKERAQQALQDTINYLQSLKIS
jgi:hypothetical protein